MAELVALKLLANDFKIGTVPGKQAMLLAGIVHVDWVTKRRSKERGRHIVGQATLSCSQKLFLIR